ncbi:MAG: 1-deoxy-D-xylulose-5-phosphate reductoisomerase [Paludibacteraceae bacterium]|nr:1-deoxy-D-xylulose-5-phosphate reductoisomerase [Paludibacteraceae bacterium]
MRNIVILGSTGSIGRQALDVISSNADKYSLYAITGNNNVDLLIEQARQFRPEVVCIANEAHYPEVSDALQDLPIKVFAGMDAICDVVTFPSVDVVLSSLVGFAGLRPTISAIKASKTIALANKETLVVAGELICELCAKHNVKLLPVDSEHSAIFQCLNGEGNAQVEKILLTASGGPFRNMNINELGCVTAADALRHPTWTMGDKITIDSASLMNKGFEVIEAKWLFGIESSRIEVVVHPESIIHSMVEFTDGSIKAQLGVPDMRLPIQYALSYPERWHNDYGRVDFFKLGTLHFERPQMDKFRNLQLAYDAIERGGNIPCSLNAANEVVNLAFRQGKIDFLQMSDIMQEVIDKVDFIKKPTYEDYILTDDKVRKITKELL